MKEVRMITFDNDVSPTKDEMDSYCSDIDNSLALLDRHPAMKNVFVTHNTALPSIAPVERLFSIAALL